MRQLLVVLRRGPRAPRARASSAPPRRSGARSSGRAGRACGGARRGARPGSRRAASRACSSSSARSWERRSSPTRYWKIRRTIAKRATAGSPSCVVARSVMPRQSSAAASSDGRSGISERRLVRARRLDALDVGRVGGDRRRSRSRARRRRGRGRGGSSWCRAARVRARRRVVEQRRRRSAGRRRRPATLIEQVRRAVAASGAQLTRMVTDARSARPARRPGARSPSTIARKTSGDLDLVGGDLDRAQVARPPTVRGGARRAAGSQFASPARRAAAAMRSGEQQPLGCDHQSGGTTTAWVSLCGGVAGLGRLAVEGRWPSPRPEPAARRGRPATVSRIELMKRSRSSRR